MNKKYIYGSYLLYIKCCDYAKISFGGKYEKGKRKGKEMRFEKGIIWKENVDI
jgi:hypothetical protein